MKFEYLKIPIHRYTFAISSLKKWIENECRNLYTLNLFAGITKLNINEVRNDVDKSMNAQYHFDALEFCEYWIDKSKPLFEAIILDPPYSYRKSMEYYNGHGCSKFNLTKDILPVIMKNNCKIITFGYHSISMGKNRNCQQEKILLMYHSGAIHDTIAAVEKYEPIEFNR